MSAGAQGSSFFLALDTRGSRLQPNLQSLLRYVIMACHRTETVSSTVGRWANGFRSGINLNLLSTFMSFCLAKLRNIFPETLLCIYGIIVNRLDGEARWRALRLAT